MKAYLLTIPERLRMLSQSLDVKAALCGKTWSVFNDESSQLFIFHEDGSLDISTDGEVSLSTWRFLPENGSIIITTKDKSTMLIPSYIDMKLLALQQIGTEKVYVLIDEKNSSEFPRRTIGELNDYLHKEEKKAIQAEAYEKERIIQELAKAEKERNEQIQIEKTRLAEEEENNRKRDAEFAAFERFEIENRAVIVAEYKKLKKRRVLFYCVYFLLIVLYIVSPFLIDAAQSSTVTNASCTEAAQPGHSSSSSSQVWVLMLLFIPLHYFAKRFEKNKMVDFLRKAFANYYGSVHYLPDSRFATLYLKAKQFK